MKKSLYLIFALSACIHAAEQEEYYNSPRIIDQFIQYYKNFSEYLLETTPDTPPLLSEEERALCYSIIPKKLRTYFSQENMVCDQEIKDLFTALITRPYHKDIATFLADVYKKQFTKFEQVISPEILNLICKKYSKDLPKLAFDFMHKASFKNDDIMCTYLTVLDGYNILEKYYDLFESFNENKQLVVYSLVEEQSYQSLLFLLNHKDLSIEKITQKDALWSDEHTLLHKFICWHFKITDISKKVITKTIDILKQYDLLNQRNPTYKRDKEKDKEGKELIFYAFEPYRTCAISRMSPQVGHPPNFIVIDMLLEEPTLNITDLAADNNGNNTLLHTYVCNTKFGSNAIVLKKIINCLAKKNALNQKNITQETALNIALSFDHFDTISMLEHPDMSVLNLNANNDNALVVYNTYKCHDPLVLTKIIKKLIIEEPNKEITFTKHLHLKIDSKKLLDSFINIYEIIAKYALATNDKYLFNTVCYHCGLPPVKMYTHPYAPYSCKNYPLNDLLKKVHEFHNMLLHQQKNKQFCDLIIE